MILVKCIYESPLTVISDNARAVFSYRLDLGRELKVLQMKTLTLSSWANSQRAFMTMLLCKAGFHRKSFPTCSDSQPNIKKAGCELAQIDQKSLTKCRSLSYLVSIELADWKTKRTSKVRKEKNLNGIH